MIHFTNELSSFVDARIRRLLDQSATGAGKARLAELRRGVGKTPGELPALWGVMLEDMPEPFQSQRGEPSRAEWAIYTALTLFALHQQGNTAAMSVRSKKTEDGQFHNHRLGAAVLRLCHDAQGLYTDEDRKRVERRFLPMATADTMPELAHHLRGLIQLLKADGIPLDYPSLAVDLYRYQDENCRNAVRLLWGQDFYKVNFKDSEGEKNEQ